MNLAWTPEQDQRLTEMRNQGYSASIIAERLNRTLMATRCRAGKIGAPLNTEVDHIRRDTIWTREMDDLLRNWRDEGFSFGVIAKKLNMTRNACIGRSHRLKIQSFNPLPRINLWNRKPARPPTQRVGSKPYTPRIIREFVMADLRPIPPDTPWRTTKPLGEPASLMERHPQGCCFIPGDDHIYCNAHKLADFDYCPTHYVIMRRYTAPMPPRQRLVSDAADRVVENLAVAA